MSNDLCALATSAIRSNPYTSQVSVQVSEREDCLVLGGVVHTYYAKQMAQEVVKRIGGIGTIRNEVQVARQAG